jgi:hypothetical protein
MPQEARGGPYFSTGGVTNGLCSFIEQYIRQKKYVEFHSPRTQDCEAEIRNYQQNVENNIRFVRARAHRWMAGAGSKSGDPIGIVRLWREEKCSTDPTSYV